MCSIDDEVFVYGSVRLDKAGLGTYAIRPVGKLLYEYKKPRFSSLSSCPKPRMGLGYKGGRTAGILYMM